MVAHIPLSVLSGYPGGGPWRCCWPPGVAWHAGRSPLATVLVSSVPSAPVAPRGGGWIRGECATGGNRGREVAAGGTVARCDSPSPDLTDSDTGYTVWQAPGDPGAGCRPRDGPVHRRSPTSQRPVTRRRRDHPRAVAGHRLSAHLYDDLETIVVVGLTLYNGSVLAEFLVGRLRPPVRLGRRQGRCDYSESLRLTGSVPSGASARHFSDEFT
jgi:hypothetical protein